uniref:Reverse transcriptase domain-containing protein n=1 Tax=Tanacetum cinerariifolium TaxID=118510 RepID=A0A699I759_TANCI|nr:hypothetical protein [Tanacetum cinerariifolium]
MHKAFPLPRESSHWQYKFPLPVEGVPSARRMEIPLPGVCTAIMKKLPVKDRWQEKIVQAPKASPGKRLKAITKMAKSEKKKLPAKGLETLSKVALSEAEQKQIAIKRSKTQFHSSQANGPGTHEGTGVISGVLDVPTYGSDDEHISWKSSDDEDDDAQNDDNADDEDDDVKDDDNKQTESDNDGDDFVHPKLSTFDEEARQDKEDKEAEGSDLRVQTPFHFESTNDEVTQGDNVEEEKLDEEKTNKKEEVNELYNDVNINLEGRDTEMTDALLANVQATQVIEDTYVIMTYVTPEVQQQSSSVSSGFISNMLNPTLHASIDFILNLNTESTSLVDVSVTTNDDIPPSSVTTLPPLPIPLIHPLQQTSVFTPTIALSTSLQNLPTFGSLFKFEDRVKAIENDFSKFKQTNLFAEAVSLIPDIVDTYLANKMNEAIIKEQVKVQVKEQVYKILPRIKKLVNEQLETEVLTRSSNEAKTSHLVAAKLSELELKKILIDKMESNKLIHRSNQQKTLYKALIDAYETEKVILEPYGDTITFKRRQDDEDKDEEPFAGSNCGSKRRRARKEPESTSEPNEKTSKSTGSYKEVSKSKTMSTDKSTQADEEVHSVKDLEEPSHQEFEIGFTEDHTIDEITQHPDWFQKPARPPTPDHPRETFNKLMDTPLDFSAFVLNRLNVDTLTLELLAGPTFKLMKGSCKSLVELEYFLKKVCKATTDQLDWNNLKGQQYPHDLRKPLPLIPNSRGHQVIPFDHFIKNDLAYLTGGVSSRTYATLVTKIKAANYGYIKWIDVKPKF